MITSESGAHRDTPDRPTDARATSSRPSPSPSDTTLESRLARIWRDTLGITDGEIDPDTPAAELASSPDALSRLAAAIATAFALPFTPDDLARHSTIRRQARHLRLQRLRRGPTSRAAIARRTTPGSPAPLSLTQQRLWLLEQLSPGSTAYNLEQAWRLRGPIDTAALARAFDRLVARHEPLRTRFNTIDEEPMQVIDPPTGGTLRIADLPPGDGDVETRLEEALRREAARPIDLANGPVFRAHLYRLGPDDHALLVCEHHIISDGWSRSVLAAEISAFYTAETAGRTPSVPDLPIRYADFAVWQREQIASGRFEKALRFWKEELGTPIPRLQLPADNDHASPGANPLAEERLPLSADLSDRLREFARAHGCSPFMVMAALWQILLHRLSGQKHFAVGTVVTGRNAPELEPLIGFFVNTLVLRADFENDPSFADFLTAVKTRILRVLDAQDVPFATLVETLNPPREAGETPWFQVSFAYQNTPKKPLSFPGVDVSEIPVVGSNAKFDISLHVHNHSKTQPMTLRFEYNAARFSPETIRDIGLSLCRLSEAIIPNPALPVSRIPILDAAQEQALLALDPPIDRESPPERLHDGFEAQARRTPDAVALVFRDRTLTYLELDERADTIAAHLRRLGIGPGSVVGVHMHRSLELIESLLGILKAGGAYLPLDPALPSERLEYMAATAGARLILTHGAAAPGTGSYADTPLIDVDSLSGGAPSGTALETRPAGPEDLAYVIFTSGSTGRPKGAAIPHRAAGNLMRWTRESFGFHAGDVFLQKTPFTFDASVPEIFAPLHCGARLVIAEPEGHRDPDYLGRVIQEHRVTILKVVPSQLRLLLAHPHFAARASSLRMIFPGGEALSGTIRDECRRQLPRAEIINLYGPTEAAVNTLFWRCRPGEADSVVPIGRPVTNNRAFVVDPHGNLVPFGVAGELLISGLSVGSGYINQPELTRERFLPDPFPGGEGLTAYRTGDLVRRRRDGVIEFLGRIDHQVKIRGYRIELGEIEAIAREHPGVREAVVLAREAPDGDLRLVAWLETASDDFDEDAFRGHLERRLPEYMVPAAIVAMERLPQLPNGKVDRKALPEPEPAAPAPAAQSSEPPATAVEKRLAKIWCDVLGIGSVSRDDHFFHLGGHSLTAMRVAARASETFGTPVHMTWLFAHPSLRALAEKIDQSLAAAPASAPSAASQDTLSHQEARLWFLHQTLERPESYNVPWIAVASAPLDPAALENAFRTLADRHEALRTAFITDQHGEPRRRIADALTIPVHVETTTSDGTPFRDREAIEARAREILAMPFAIDTAPLLRVHLLRSADGTDTLVVVAHHIIVDQWSMQVLIGELGTILREGAAALPPPPSITLSAYAARQRAHDHSGSLAFWIDQLRDAPGTVQLPIDRARPAIATGRGAHHRFRLSRETASGLEALARESHATRFTVGLALYAAFLSRIGGDDDIVIGTPLADRTQPELQRLVGFMLNTLPIRLRPAANLPFRQWLDRARAIILESLAHGDAPLDKIVKAIPAARAGHTAPFSVMFVHQDEPENELELNGTACERLLVSSGTAKADLTLFLAPTADGTLAANLEFSLDLFAPEAGERLARWLSTFAAHAAAHPDTPLDRLPLEPGDRLADELAAFNQTATDYPREKTVAELFREQAAATPQRPALIHGETTLTYAELESRANRLARHLSARGVRRGDFVILQIERSTAFVEAVLATLKCGAAYVPVATDLPAKRLAVIVEDTGSRHLVRDGRIQTPPPADIDCFHLVEDAAAIAAHSDDFETVPAAATDAAYVMFTSGSTGRPKGVVIPHRGIIRLVRDQPALPISEETATLLLAPLAFDASTFEIWAPLLNGGRCVIYPHPHPEPDLLAATIQNHAVNTLWLTAGLFNHLVDHAPEALRGVRHLLTGGDALSIPHVRRALEVLEEVQLYNGYGPTESTTFATIEPIRRDDPFLTGTVPIGRPIANTTCHVLDAHQQPVPPGIAGELYIGGDGLALGYLNDETLTRQRFVPDPFSPPPAARLYRTGDRCRWLPDGRLEFLGRLDNQVKIRGFRIEPGEIEAALLRHPAVARCAVVVSRSSVGEKRLVAWIVPEDGADPTPQALRAFLASSLPDYMIPSAFLIEDELPLNANGKIDRRALAARPVEIRETRHTATTPSPRHETEARLLRIWRQLLDTSEIGVDDDFFQLGGHSLLAMRMIHEVHREFGHTLRIADLLRAPTISGLAALLGADTASPAEERVSTFSGHGPGTPLFNIPGVMGYGLIPEALAEAIYGQRPYHDGLQIPGADKQSAPLDSLPEIASHLVKQIRAVQPHGPYCLTGFCFGGLLAYETAHQLVAAGEAVQALVLWHAFPFHLWKYRTLRRRLAEIPRGIRQGKLPYYIRRFGESVRFHLGVRLRILHPQPEALDWARDNPSIVEANRRAQRSYRAPETTIPTLVIRGNDRHGRYDIPPKGGWEYLCKGPFEIVDLPIDHITMLDEPWISQVTRLTARWLRQTDPQR